MMKEQNDDMFDSLLKSALQEETIPDMPSTLIDSLEETMKRKTSWKQLVNDYWIIVTVVCVTVVAFITLYAFLDDSTLIFTQLFEKISWFVGALMILLYVLFLDKVVLTFLFRQKKN